MTTASPTVPIPSPAETPALETLKGYDVSTADKTVDVAPTVTFPAWATIDTSAMKTALTITNKFQVTVTATAPGDITYGAALGDPSASQTAGAHGTDASGTYTYCYEGSGSTDYGPSAEKPVNAGTYTVTATLVSDTHAGISAPAAFAIGKKALTEGMLTITGTYVYTGSSITPSYTVADGALLQESDYTAAVTNNVNAAKSDGASAPTVTITAAENGNYSGSLSKTFTIAPKSIAGVSVDGYSSSYTYTGRRHPAWSPREGRRENAGEGHGLHAALRRQYANQRWRHHYRGGQGQLHRQHPALFVRHHPRPGPRHCVDLWYLYGREHGVCSCF